MGNKRIQVIVFLSLVAFTTAWIWWVFAGMLTPLGAGPDKTIVTIPKGASASEVGRILAKKHIIRSAFAFRLLVRFSGKSGLLKPGAYELGAGMTPLSILQKITGGSVAAVWITFPEGFTVWQMGERLQANGIGSSDKFVDVALHHGDRFKTGFPHQGDSLEGYLFPDTYLIPTDASEDDVIRSMLDSFDRKVAGPLGPEIRASGMSLKQVVTLASLIEREAKIRKDRPLISAVLHNRIKKGMCLECDATILYALGKHKKRVLFKDLDVKSPYNTYRNPGLPPGPIANPGLDSIKAAIHPANVDYLYYVARSDGSHIFTRTFEEHQHAKLIARGKVAS